jgi:hypothetical protein
LPFPLPFFGAGVPSSSSEPSSSSSSSSSSSEEEAAWSSSESHSSFFFPFAADLRRGLDGVDLETRGFLGFEPPLAAGEARLRVVLCTSG